MREAHHLFASLISNKQESQNQVANRLQMASERETIVRESQNQVASRLKDTFPEKNIFPYLASDIRGGNYIDFANWDRIFCPIYTITDPIYAEFKNPKKA